MGRDMREKQPPRPTERHETVRRELVEILRQGHELGARDISAAARIPERSVPEHLEHIRRTLLHDGSGLVLRVSPARCLQCGFVFSKRTRLTRPGRCPVCKQSHITEPLFSIEGARQR